jgi:hypothetical protein
MLKENFFRSRLLIYAIMGSFSLLFFPHEALSSAQTGTLTGFIFAEDMKTPVENAVVLVRNVKTKIEFRSNSTDKSGSYVIKNLEEGLYVLGVSAPIGDFNFGYQVRIKANEIAKLSLALKQGKKRGAILAGTPGAGVVAGAVTGAGAIAGAGAAGAGFFLTPVGIAVIVSASAALVYGGITVFGEEEPKSQSKK